MYLNIFKEVYYMVSILSGTHSYIIINAYLTALFILPSAGIVGSIEII